MVTDYEFTSHDPLDREQSLALFEAMGAREQWLGLPNLPIKQVKVIFTIDIPGENDEVAPC